MHLADIYHKYDKKYENASGGYISSDGHDDYNEIRYDFNTKKFDFIEIILNFDKDNIDDIYSIIMHELIHAYDDYIHIKKSFETLFGKSITISVSPK